LIVDDEPKNLTVLETVLDDPAYRLVRAESGRRGFARAGIGAICAPNSRHSHAGNDGFRVGKIIKERKKTARVPIIFLTAYTAKISTC
jgi:CheY-like chemotaxis protein